MKSFNNEKFIVMNIFVIFESYTWFNWRNQDVYLCQMSKCILALADLMKLFHLEDFLANIIDLLNKDFNAFLEKFTLQRKKSFYFE